MRHWRIHLVMLLIVLAGSAWWVRVPRTSGPLGQDVYVWQRQWTDGVKSSLAAHGSQFKCVVALGAQIWWKEGRAQVARVEIDWSALERCDARIGLAMRINSFRGPFTAESENTALLCEVARDLIERAKAQRIDVCEMQIDFDAAESRLQGYQVWVEAVARNIAPVKVVITALPSWLDTPAFEALARQSGEYILQVHSFERPALGERMTLCDVERARRAVDQAGRIGVPFRVALPTYGHVAAFDPQNRLLGVSAEGRSDTWASGAILHEVHADAAEMAGLVRAWTANRPAVMKGVIWYRLPVAEDALNWRWPTLASVMAGQAPVSSLRVEQAHDEHGIVTLILVNDGQADEPQDMRIVARGNVEAFDGFGPFRATGASGGVTFLCEKRDRRIGAGDRFNVGWVRTGGKEVIAHVER